MFSLPTCREHSIPYRHYKRRKPAYVSFVGLTTAVHRPTCKRTGGSRRGQRGPEKGGTGPVSPWGYTPAREFSSRHATQVDDIVRMMTVLENTHPKGEAFRLASDILHHPSRRIRRLVCDDRHSTQHTAHGPSRPSRRAQPIILTLVIQRHAYHAQYQPQS